MTLYYAGIGSRETPINILNNMTQIAEYLANKNYILRSGGAAGADTAFEVGANHKAATSQFCDEPIPEIFYATDCTEEAMKLSAKYHPAWHRCSDFAKKLHGRNAMILLGQNLDTPVKFVVCYTTDGLASGGTGQALRIAQDLKIQIFNLHDKATKDRLMSKVLGASIPHKFVVHCKKQTYDVYIGRPSEWGNPFTHKDNTIAKYKVKDRDEAVNKYREWLMAQPELVNKAKRELKGKILGCWCSPQACHGDVLAEVANS